MASGAWEEWSQHVLHELVRLDECYKASERSISKNYNCHKQDVAKLRLDMMQSMQTLKEEMIEGFQSIRLEQIKLKMKIAIIAAVLTTIGNGLLFIIIRGILRAFSEIPVP
jgi:hypothetical protein